MENKFYLRGKLELQEETTALKEKASKVIKLPKEEDKQPDLMYFSAILVSSGENLNHAYFLGSELFAAEGTITNKALDLEHQEQAVIGHLFDKVYTDKDGSPLDMKELSSRETASLDEQDMHIQIAGIIYKSRFPELAAEIEDGDWPAVSMECYYKDYDVKIGNIVLPRREAEVLGLASVDDSLLGKMAKVVKDGKEIASGGIARVLRGICFSGCGIVKNPANPLSVIFEVANNNSKGSSTNKEDTIILDYDKIDKKDGVNNVTTVNTEAVVKKEDSVNNELDNAVGICVNYKRRVFDKNEKIIAEDWCSLFDKSCTSFSRDTTDPGCLRNKAIRAYAKAFATEIIESSSVVDRRKELLDDLKAALSEAVKTISRR